MYIELTVTLTEYQFQRKDEAGADIGSVDTFATTDYTFIYGNNSFTLVSAAAGVSVNGLPRYSVPLSRLIIINTT